MAYVSGEEREQLSLMPACLDDYIGANNICRVIAAYVDSLNMEALGFKYAQTKGTGRPPHNPSNMLMLYLYGYMNRIRSSRRLEAETTRNVEVMWVMKKVIPDDKTICNFRKDNAAALKKAFREFSLWSNRQGLYGRELIAVDGTKIRADNSRRNIHTKRNTELLLGDVDRKIDEYMGKLAENDAAEQGEPELSTEAIREILERLQARKTRLEDWRTQIEANGGYEIAEIDPDCRMMKQGGNARALDACYNVQTVVDDKHKLIVDFEVTNSSDEKDALPKMTEAAKALLGVSAITVLADKGYYEPEDIAKCEQNQTICLIASVKRGAWAPDSEFNHEAFQYDKERDCYICPMGNAIPFKRTRRAGKIVGREYHNSAACNGCPKHTNCTKDKRASAVFRNPHQDALDIVDARMRTHEGRCTYKKRKEIVEHPFGTTKRAWGFGNFLCRGRERVTGEQSLVFLAYNFRRVYNIFHKNGADLVAAFS